MKKYVFSTPCISKDEEEKEGPDQRKEYEVEKVMGDLPQVVPFSSADEESLVGRIAPMATANQSTLAKVCNPTPLTPSSLAHFAKIKMKKL